MKTATAASSAPNRLIAPALAACLLAACQPPAERVATTQDTVTLDGVTMHSIASPPPAGEGLTGAAAGTLLSALTPPAVAAALPPSDIPLVQRALIRAHSASPGERIEWSNGDTGNHGAVIPSAMFRDGSGGPCRAVVHLAHVAGRELWGDATACRQPDGTWARGLS
jgi:surface antigen